MAPFSLTLLLGVLIALTPLGTDTCVPALPAIGAGIALGGMEVVNELGAVELLGVPTLSGGILMRWQQEGDPQAAVALALVALLIVGLLVGAERSLRRRSRCWNLGNDGQADRKSTRLNSSH